MIVSDHEQVFARGGLFLLTVALLGSPGCGGGGSSESTVTQQPGVAKLIPESKLYHVEGSGANQKKVAVSTQERMRLIREARENAKSQ